MGLYTTKGWLSIDTCHKFILSRITLTSKNGILFCLVSIVNMLTWQNLNNLK